MTFITKTEKKAYKLSQNYVTLAQFDKHGAKRVKSTNIGTTPLRVLHIQKIHTREEAVVGGGRGWWLTVGFECCVCTCLHSHSNNVLWRVDRWRKTIILYCIVRALRAWTCLRACACVLAVRTCLLFSRQCCVIDCWSFVCVCVCNTTHKLMKVLAFAAFWVNL